MMKYFILLAIILLTTIEADVVILKNGGKLRGIVKKQTKNKVIITLPYGTLIVEKRLIKKIIRSITPLDIYNEKSSQLKNEDLEGHYNLALWCKENGLYIQHKKELEHIIRLDSTHEKARKALGYQYINGRWVSYEEAMKIKGYVEHKGKWITREEFYRKSLQEIKKQLKEEKYYRIALEEKLKAARTKIYSLEKELHTLIGRVKEIAKKCNQPRYIYRRIYVDK